MVINKIRVLIVCGFIAGWFSAAYPADEKKAETAAVQHITLKEAKDIYDKGEAKIIDARPEHVWMDNHITGSISVSANRFDYFYPRNIKNKISPDELVMIYCSDTKCKLSEHVAEKLEKLGYKKIKVFTGGWDEWKAAGYPMEGLKVKK